jgi:hypothetical protein
MRLAACRRGLFRRSSRLSRPAGVDKAKAAAWQIFAGLLSQKIYACFVRRCDATHLTTPKQKVGAMKLLVSRGRARSRPSNCSFRIGFKYRHGTGRSSVERHPIITYHFLVFQ